MSGNGPRSSSRPRQGPPSTAPPVVPSSYPPAPSPPRAPASHVPSENDPLASDTSPYQGGQGFTAQDFAHYARNNPSSPTGDEAYTAISLGEPSAYETIHGDRGNGHNHRTNDSLDYPDSFTVDGDVSNHNLPRSSLSTHNSRTNLRPVNFGPSGILPPGASSVSDPEKVYDSRPSHASPSVRMELGQNERAERQYGSGGEKSGYSTPRGRSHERGASRGGGLGQWSGAGGGNSPYGKLGDGASGFNSAASSNPNLQFAEVRFPSHLSFPPVEPPNLLLPPHLSLDSPPVPACSNEQGDFIEPSSNWFSKTVFAIYNSHYVVRWMCAFPVPPLLFCLTNPLSSQHLHHPRARPPLDSRHRPVDFQGWRLRLGSQAHLVVDLAHRRLVRLVGRSAGCVDFPSFLLYSFLSK
jgi:hypothetical protein